MLNIFRIIGLFIATGLGVGSLQAQETSQSEIVIHAGRLIDGVSKSVREKVSIIIQGDRITALESGYVERPGGRVIDLSGSTVLPGLIDCHVHLTSWPVGADAIVNMFTVTGYDRAFASVDNARRTLYAGFTSVRDVGAPDPGVAIALKKAIARGAVAGPRMFTSGAILGPTGGHSDRGNGLDPSLHIESLTQWIIDGPDSARHAVRKLRQMGADLIKIAPSGGITSIGDDPNLQLMSDEEIKATVDTAHALGMKVAAHAQGKQAIDHAVALGADSIEHGTFADRDSFAAMKARGVYLVPTMLVGRTATEIMNQHPERIQPSIAAKARNAVAVKKRGLSEAYQAGVKIAFGTDDILSAAGRNAKEFALMTEAGIPAMDAILTATRNAADLIGDSNDIGSIQPGRYADIIAVGADPLADVTELEHVSFVMKGGKIYKEGGNPLPY